MAFDLPAKLLIEKLALQESRAMYSSPPLTQSPWRIRAE